MSINILDLLTQVFGGNFAGPASRFLGESESNTKSALASMVPALLGAVVQKGSTPEGASSLLSLINSPQVDSGIVGNISQLLGSGGDPNRLVNTGSGLISSLLGTNSGPLTSALSSTSGLSASTTTKLLGLAAPILFGWLKKLVLDRSLNSNSLMSLFRDQTKSIHSAIDPRIAQALNLRLPEVPTGAREVATETAGGLGKILPWLIALLAAALLFWLMRSCSTHTVQDAADATRATVDAAKTTAESAAQTTADAVNATADAAKTAADAAGQKAAEVARAGAAALRSIQLPDGASFEIPTGGFVDSLITFLNGNAPAGQAFAFDAVTFESDSATLDPASNAQLTQLAAVLKAYPTVVIAVEGHTDHTGDAGANKKLSEDRALAVRGVIVGMGVPVERVTSAGWGAEKPIASNDTEEGKLQNRRVEISITQR